ncbi:AlpA family phage regulatory protein [Robbsia andropogonis]|uniref:AlpA family phage regulatory protein n=1 Tax=Robbsia andropogonis TaxID=28092 RepID=UPI003D23D0C2
MKKESEAISAAVRPSSPAPSSGLRVLRLADLSAKVGMRKSAIYQMMSENAFPRPFKLNARAVGWLESDVDAWILDRSKVAATD